MESTRERILDEALIMFAENGYRGANLRDLAARLSLSKSALYKHYDSKEAIWHAVLDKMEAHYARNFGSVDNLPPTPDSCEELVQLSLRMIHFTVSDPHIILTRRLIITEQFHDERVCRMATKYFLEGTAGIYEKVFAGMMAKGLLKPADPAMLAFSFTAPVSSLIHLCAREPERQAEALARAEAFVRYFVSIHAA
ncbi:MAG: TetR/AcrR family transcriptional regulator [Clostridia bacterium]|nr:TetR/AcrR family transcriptional regulator [Clostridia bacterium]